MMQDQEDRQAYAVHTGAIVPRRRMGLDRINKTDGIRQDKEYRRECTGPREQAGLCRTKMTNGIAQDKDKLDKMNRTYGI
jgi:hypothetical protein